MIENFFVGAVTEYRGTSLIRMQGGAPVVGVSTQWMSGGPR